MSEKTSEQAKEIDLIRGCAELVYRPFTREDIKALIDAWSVEIPKAEEEALKKAAGNPDIIAAIQAVFKINNKGLAFLQELLVDDAALKELDRLNHCINDIHNNDPEKKRLAYLLIDKGFMMEFMDKAANNIFQSKLWWANTLEARLLMWRMEKEEEEDIAAGDKATGQAINLDEWAERIYRPLTREDIEQLVGALSVDIAKDKEYLESMKNHPMYQTMKGMLSSSMECLGLLGEMLNNDSLLAEVEKFNQKINAIYKEDPGMEGLVDKLLADGFSMDFIRKIANNKLISRLWWTNSLGAGLGDYGIRQGDSSADETTDPETANKGTNSMDVVVNTNQIVKDTLEKE